MSQFLITLASNNKEVLSSELFTKLANSQLQFRSLNDCGLCLDPSSEEYAFTKKESFSFVPVMAKNTNLPELNATFGLEIENPDQALSKLSEKFPDLNFGVLNEETAEFTIGVNKVVPEGERNTEKAIVATLKSIFANFGEDLKPEYFRYFLNNCFNSNGAKMTENGKNGQIDDIHTEISSYFQEKTQNSSQSDKTNIEKYTESFNFRPFFGEGLKKLPKCDRSGKLSGDVATWNWDEMYINPGMDSEVFIKEEKTQVVEEAKPNKESQGVGTGGEITENKAVGEGGEKVSVSVGTGM